MDVYIHVCGLNVTGNCRDGSYSMLDDTYLEPEKKSKQTMVTSVSQSELPTSPIASTLVQPCSGLHEITLDSSF